MNQRRYQILRKVETGELSIEAGNRLLADLEAEVYEEEEGSPAPEPEQVPLASPDGESAAAQPEVIHDGVDADAERRMKRWKRWWILPFGVGVFLTIISAVWMFQGYLEAGFGWRFWLSWFPFSLGLLLVVASWHSQTLPWVHIRIREGKENYTNISLSLPIPIGLASWGLRRYKSYAPDQYEKVHLDEVKNLLNETLAQDAPMHVVVDDEDDDTHVEVFITGGRKR